MMLNSPILRCFMRSGELQSVQKYLRISSWPQHIPIYNLPALEKDRKSEEDERSVPRTLCEKNKKNHKSIVTSLFQGREMTSFWRISLYATKNGSFIIIINAKGSGLTQMNLRSLQLRWSFMEENFCFVYGGITVLLFISSFQTVDTQYRLILSTAVVSCTWKSLRKRPTFVNKRNVFL